MGFSPRFPDDNAPAWAKSHATGTFVENVMLVAPLCKDLVIGVRSAIGVRLHAAEHATDNSRNPNGFLLQSAILMPNCTAVRLERFSVLTGVKVHADQ